jgi:hypothetical protein
MHMQGSAVAATTQDNVATCFHHAAANAPATGPSTLAQQVLPLPR